MQSLRSESGRVRSDWCFAEGNWSVAMSGICVPWVPGLKGPSSVCCLVSSGSIWGRKVLNLSDSRRCKMKVLSFLIRAAKCYSNEESVCLKVHVHTQLGSWSGPKTERRSRTVSKRTGPLSFEFCLRSECCRGIWSVVYPLSFRWHSFCDGWFHQKILGSSLCHKNMNLKFRTDSQVTCQQCYITIPFSL
jgi:hypothetical protein